MAEPQESTANPPGWRSPTKMIGDVLDRWPRLVALAKCQIWFMMLLAVSFVIGWAISITERPAEIESNDAYMRRAFMAENLPIDPAISNLIALPAACLIRFKAKLEEEEQELQRDNSANISITRNNSNNFAIGSFTDQAIADLNYLRIEDAILTNTNTTWEEFSSYANMTFDVPRTDITINTKNYSAVETIDSTEYYDYLAGGNASNVSLGKTIIGYAEACRGIAEELLLSLIDFAIALNGVEGDLSFNWIRCSNVSSRFYQESTEEQRQASLLPSQMLFFGETWNANRKEIFDSLVAKKGCEIMPNDTIYNISSSFDEMTQRTSAKDLCYWEATMKSVSEATGGGGCKPNVSSAAWFWFTVMTTVGYGNAPPSTFPSRVLVYCFGWLMIIAFGGIMVKIGFVLRALLDDLLNRTNLKRLRKPQYAAPFWAFTSAWYIVFVAWQARVYWDSRIPLYEYKPGDSYWFSYITLLTVGLGDFYIQPQGLFPLDVIRWTFFLLYGFGVLAAFLDRFSNLLASFFPERKEPLEYHLARTELFCGSGINTPYSKSLEILRELVADGCIEDDQTGQVKETMEEKYRSSFSGRDCNARTPDGSTIHLHRIRILTEKKTLLIKLLLANQSELDDRIDVCESDIVLSADVDQSNCKHENRSNSMVGSILSSRFNRKDYLPLPTIASLKHDEEALKSILNGTQKLRRQIDSNAHDDESGASSADCEIFKMNSSET